MNSTERLPQDDYLYGMPKGMVPYCGYARGKIILNGASMILCPVTRITIT